MRPIKAAVSIRADDFTPDWRRFPEEECEQPGTIYLVTDGEAFAFVRQPAGTELLGFDLDALRPITLRADKLDPRTEPGRFYRTYRTSKRASEIERSRQLAELRAKAPLQSKGKPVEDAGHLPLFIAGNEPSLL